MNQRVQFTKRAKYLRLFSRVDWTFERFIIKGLSCSTRPASDKSLRVSRPPFLPFIDRRPSSWPPSVFSSLGPELIRVGTNLSLQQSLYPEKNLSHLSYFKLLMSYNYLLNLQSVNYICVNKYKLQNNEYIISCYNKSNRPTSILLW